MSLSYYVDLYRAAGKPTVDGTVFTGKFEFSPDNVRLIRHLRRAQPDGIDDLFVDGNPLPEKGELPESGTDIEFFVRLPGRSGSRFHKSVGELIEGAPSLSKGEMIDEFYIVSEDYYSGDGKTMEAIDNLANLCRFIRYLSDLALYHDKKTSDRNLNLIFVQPNGAESVAPIEIVTKIEERMLTYEPPDICLIDNLCNTAIQTDPHLDMKRGVFGVTLIDFLKNRSPNHDNFDFLIRYWNDFIVLYRKNLQTYLSGFAFHKAKKEVAQDELELAQGFSKVMSDITGKVLSIPISFAAVIAIIKSSSFAEDFFLAFGLLVAGFIIHSTVRNQQKQLQCISDAKTLKFKSIEGRKDSFPEDLQISINNMTTRLNRNEQDLKIKLWFFIIMCWVPFLVGLWLFIVKHHEVLFGVSYLCLMGE